MGLDFSRGDARWAYSGFNRFREKLGNEIGIDLRKMLGFGPPYISWDGINDDIVLLLNHSDCDGELSPNECSLIAPRLRELIKDWDDDEYDTYTAKKLANAMDECARLNEPLIFC